MRAVPEVPFRFLALAPFPPKITLVGIFGRNLLDDESQLPGFDALLEYREHKALQNASAKAASRAPPCNALAQRPEWRGTP